MANLVNEYPRPQFQREDWLNLNGEWDFCFDDTNQGLKETWYKSFPKESVVRVPFAYQAELSGIGDTRFHDIVWYHRIIHVPKAWQDKRIRINFGAVDYHALVYLNGERVGEHTGGQTSFSFDITDFLTNGDNSLVLRVEDPSTDATIPRGKQYWHEESASIFYTRTTGIWQTVWLEPIGACYLLDCRFTPDIDDGSVQFETTVEGDVDPSTRLEIQIRFKGQEIIHEHVYLCDAYVKRKFDIRNRFTDRSNIHDAGWYWTPDHPNLFDVTLRLVRDEKITDEISSYFGMRKVSTDGGVFKLNNKTFYQKLILDQGYFNGGLLTAPSDDALKKDILLAKEMGFNGARKHQKVEDPRFYYWADTLGFVVWGEMANASEYSEAAVARLTHEWLDVVKRDYNHPSLIVWVPLNESWGISRVAFEKRQQHHALSMYHLTKSIDETRPVMSNEGWEHTKSDLCGIHNYQSAEEMEKAYQTVSTAIETTPADRPIYASGHHYDGVPIMVTEYGGIAYEMDKAHSEQNWGYSEVHSREGLVAAYRKQTKALMDSPVIQGFCYTQLCDVEQEINGLLTYDRQPKCDLAKIKQINDRI